MRTRNFLAWLLVLMGTASVAAAQNPFVGTWQLDPAKSQFAGRTMKFGPAAGQAIEITTGGTTYSFRIDSKNYLMASGDLATWTQLDPATWTTRYLKPDGTLLDACSWKLSPDNQTLTVETSGVKQDGKRYANTTTYVRTAGASGLLGAWKSTQEKFSSPDEITIEAYSLGGLSLKDPSTKASLLVNFDGKAVAPVGPTVPPALTIALLRIGPASFRMIKKIAGEVVYSARYTVSADGQTMTETGNSPGDPSQILVWEKQ